MEQRSVLTVQWWHVLKMTVLSQHWCNGELFHVMAQGYDGNIKNKSFPAVTTGGFIWIPQVDRHAAALYLKCSKWTAVSIPGLYRLNLPPAHSGCMGRVLGKTTGLSWHGDGRDI